MLKKSTNKQLNKLTISLRSNKHNINNKLKKQLMSLSLKHLLIDDTKLALITILNFIVMYESAMLKNLSLLFRRNLF